MLRNWFEDVVIGFREERSGLSKSFEGRQDEERKENGELEGGAAALYTNEEDEGVGEGTDGEAGMM